MPEFLHVGFSVFREHALFFSCRFTLSFPEKVKKMRPHLLFSFVKNLNKKKTNLILCFMKQKNEINRATNALLDVFGHCVYYSVSWMYHSVSLASGTWPDRGRPGPKPGLKAEVSPATSQALAGLAKG